MTSRYKIDYAHFEAVQAARRQLVSENVISDILLLSLLCGKSIRNREITLIKWAAERKAKEVEK